MFLQINQNPGSEVSVLQSGLLQQNWHWILGTFVCIFVIWRLFTRKRKRPNTPSNLDISSKAINYSNSKTSITSEQEKTTGDVKMDGDDKDEYTEYQNYLESQQKNYADSNRSKLEKLSESADKHSFSIGVSGKSKQNEPEDVKKVLVQDLNSEHTTQRVRPAVIETITVVSQPTKENAGVHFIGYDPRSLEVHVQQLNFPYLVLPQPNSIVTFPQKGRIGRQGYKDADFHKYLSTTFGEYFNVDDCMLISANSGAMYSPDIALMDTTDTLNLMIDIEIDEPYEGTNDVEKRKAIHYKGCDDMRDSIYSNNGWIVIRFAEIQVHQNPAGCCRYIADVISKIKPEFVIPDSLKNTGAIRPTLRWTKEEAEILSKKREREKYLGIDSFGVTPESRVICVTKPTEEDKPIEGVQKSLSGDMDSQPVIPVFLTPKKNIDSVNVTEAKSKPTSITANESLHENVKNTHETTYETLTIGNQIWMVDNLNVSCYRDGTQIPEVTDEKEWQKFGEEGKGCWCYCDNNRDNRKKDVKLYNWHALNNIKGVAPEGWRIPTKDDFEKLSISFRQMLSMSNNATNFFGWYYQAERNSNGVFNIFRQGVGNRGCIMGNWWSASQSDSESPYYCSILYSGEKYGHYEYLRIENGIKGTGMAIRCVKDIEYATSKLNQKYSAVDKIITSQEKYESIKIGTQEWMVKNLDINHYSDGTPIREAKTNEEWLRYDAEKIGCWSYYNNNSKAYTKYGKLYNWHAVNSRLGLAPKGWHIPTKEEYISLLKSLSPIDNESAIKKLKSTIGWQEGCCGTNESGWSGLGGGYRYCLGAFKLIDETGYWWVDSEVSSAFACSFYLPAYVDFDAFYGAFTNKLHGDGCSVRCIKDY
jgi:uncharacterized protein (TIGR02145 family)